MNHLGWGPSDLAAKSGVALPTISALVRRASNRSDYKEDLVNGFPPDKINHGWLRDDAGDMIPSNTTSNVKFSLGQGENTEFMAINDGVPLISWIQAGIWSDIEDPYAVGDAEDWLPCPVKHGPRAYCLRVRGDSMYNPTGRPSYADGDIIFVDPDREANNGDRVIVRLDDQKEGTFKQLLVEDGRKMLKALNPEWAPRYVEINGNATITGVVIGKWVPE